MGRWVLFGLLVVNLACVHAVKTYASNSTNPLLESTSPEIEYDPYEQYTTISSTVKLKLLSQDWDNVEAYVRLLTVSRGRPEEIQKPNGILISISSSSETWAFLRCHHTGILADDSPIKIGTKHDGRVGNGYVTEHISGDISSTDFDTIARSSKAKIKVCNTEWEMDIHSIRRFAAVFQPKQQQHEADTPTKQPTTTTQHRKALSPKD